MPLEERGRGPRICQRGWFRCSIDWLSINQEDLEERGNQVGMMREIYRRARMVLVWLGTDDEQEDKQQNGCFVLDKEKPGFIYPPRDEESTWLAVNFAAQLAKCEMEGDNYSRLDHRIWFPEAMGWLVLARFFHRGWFRRLWIVQEVVMASDVMGVIGGMAFSWVAFMQATQLMYCLEGIFSSILVGYELVLPLTIGEVFKV